MEARELARRHGASAKVDSLGTSTAMLPSGAGDPRAKSKPTAAATVTVTEPAMPSCRSISCGSVVPGASAATSTPSTSATGGWPTKVATKGSLDCTRARVPAQLSSATSMWALVPAASRFAATWQPWPSAPQPRS